MKYTILKFATLSVAIVAMAMSGTAQAQYEDLILDAEPFAYWRLGDDEDEEFPLDDGVGTGIEATAENVEFGADSLVPDESNTAAVFNGIDSLIRVPDDGQTNSGGPYLNKSAELWFSVDDADLDVPQVIIEEGGATRGFAMYVLEGEIYMGAWNRNNDDGGVSSPWNNPDTEGDTQVVYVSRPIESGVAYHAAFVMEGDEDGLEGTFTGYLNGFSFGSGTGVGRLFNHGDDLGIGGMDTNIWLANDTNPGGDGLYFGGTIDEVALYNIALTDAQVRAHALADDGGIAGDFNGDGAVDLSDFAILAENFGNVISGDDSVSSGDFNRDQVVDMKDFRDWRAVFNAGEPAGASAVPEPSSLGLIGVGILALAGLRRRRS